MKRKCITIFLIATLVITFNCAGDMAFTYAEDETKADIEDELSDIEDQQEEVSNELAQVEEDIKALETKVATLKANIEATTAEIAATEESIALKEAEMAEQETNLNQRLRVMYKKGSVGFLDVLLGSSSISEFISNLDLIQKIYANDISVMETLQQEYEELEQIKAQLEETKSQLAVQQAELEAEQAQLDSKKAELEAKEDELNAAAEELEAKLQSMVDTTTEYVGGVFVWPCPSSYYITSYFGYRIHPILNVWKYHSGMDISASTGASIVAAAAGTVILSEWYSGYGYCVIIDHGGGITTLYGHCSSLLVSVGETVTQGQQIALVGSTGVSTGPHLHFEVRENGTVVEPLDYLQ